MNRKGQGRKKKPTALKVVEGSAQVQRIEPDLPPCDTDRNPPIKLIGYALEEWNRIIPALVDIQICREPDKAVLAMACFHYGLARDAMDKLHEQKEKYPDAEHLTGPHGENPYIVSFRKSASEALKFFAEFGLTPSSRGKLSVELPSGKPNKAKKYLE